DDGFCHGVFLQGVLVMAVAQSLPILSSRTRREPIPGGCSAASMPQSVLLDRIGRNRTTLSFITPTNKPQFLLRSPRRDLPAPRCHLFPAPECDLQFPVRNSVPVPTR